MMLLQGLENNACQQTCHALAPGHSKLLLLQLKACPTSHFVYKHSVEPATRLWQVKHDYHTEQDSVLSAPHISRLLPLPRGPCSQMQRL